MARSQLGGLRRAFMDNKLRNTVSGREEVDANIEANTIEWNTLYRYNWDIYAEFHLGIPLKPYQRDALHEIGVSDTFFWRAGRGGAKTFVTAVAALCKLMLYPNCWIVVTASTVDQANAIVEDKIQRELIQKLSPYLLYCYEQQWLVITKPGDGYRIENTLNNSILRVLAPVESSRRSRSNFTIYDEVAVMKKSTIDQIFQGMAFPRQAVYLTNPKYSSNPRWIEESKSIYLTSSKYKYQWWYRTWKDCVNGYYLDHRSRYNVFASDFFDNIDNGLKTWGDYRQKKRTMSDVDFRMEMLNEAIGENEDAFFTIKSFKENQTIQKCFRPPTALQFYSGDPIDFPAKKDDEVRLVCMDLAFANTTGNTKNDNTIIALMSAQWDSKRGCFERHVDYIEGHDASDSIGAADRFRYLKWVYDADYALFDSRSGGEVVMNHLTEPLEMPELGPKWDRRGLGLADKYQMVPDAKLADYHNRVVERNPEPCLIPIIATPEWNSQCWLSMRKQLETNNIKFLVSMQAYQDELVDTGDYYNHTAEELASLVEPYGQTDMLVIEAVNLKTVIKQDRVKLEEPRNGTKDRIVVVAYGNRIIDMIENAWQQQMQEDEFDAESIQLVW